MKMDPARVPKTTRLACPLHKVKPKLAVVTEYLTPLTEFVCRQLIA